MELNPKFTKEVINSGRKEKDEALEEDINIGGPTSNRYKDIIPHRIEELMDKALEQYREWIEGKLNKINAELPEESKISFDEMYEFFRATFEKRIKQQAKLAGERLEEWINGVDLEDIFNQAAFDFIQSLKSSVRRGDKKMTALKFAELSHWLNPNDIENLKKQYPDIDESIIKNAALKTPSNPEAFIESYKQMIIDLTNKYPDIDQYVIKKVALGYPSNPEVFINGYKQRVVDLANKYPDIDESVIKHASLHYPNDPHSYIKSQIKA